MRRLFCWLLRHKWQPITSEFAGAQKLWTDYRCARCGNWKRRYPTDA